MEKVDREVWLKDQTDKLKFANDLEVWFNLPMTKKLVEGMVERRAQFLAVIDDIKSSAAEVELARTRRAAITWFIQSLLETIGEKEFVQKRLTEYAEFEKNKTGGVKEK